MTRQEPSPAVAAAALTRRIELRLTQPQLAEKAGVSIRTVAYFEAHARWPRPLTRARLEEALCWPQGELERLAAEVAA